MSDAAFIVGIDLGTTNSVVAYTRVDSGQGDRSGIRIFRIPQLTGPGAIGEEEVLPSFILLPGSHDVSESALTLPWDGQPSRAVGAFARDRGAEIPHRLIASSKSWLCHTGVDRRKAILPWEAPEDQRKLSPVEASAALLRHIKEAWNYAMAEADDRLQLQRQEIYLTVPASFDAVARNLTVEAAQIAGLSEVTLLEEPQAAFYAWIDASDGKWRDLVRVGDLILVVDVGGGTTDFSLIKVSEEQGDLVLERIAVGEHLLVGGDNMDWALAYVLANRFSSKGQRLDSYQIRGLTHACRAGKERLFESQEIVSHSITVLGRGSSLIGGTIRTELTREDVEEALTNGFFPQCSSHARPQEQRRVGMREMGLPYASDPAISHHLAKFLGQSTSPTVWQSSEPVCPTAVLFNGGVMKAKALRRRVLEILSSWFVQQEVPTIREILSRDFDLAVARGAAYYGLARRGKGIRIRGGLARSYYIGVEAALPSVPGMPTPVKALCVAPFGMEEGSEAGLPAREFGLVVGEPIRFDFLGSRTRRQDTLGQVVEDWQGEIEEITTLETHLEGEAGTIIPVILELKVTELGTLEVWCVSRERDQKFKLEFNVRERGT
jgi:hypothetical protein